MRPWYVLSPRSSTIFGFLVVITEKGGKSEQREEHWLGIILFWKPSGHSLTGGKRSDDSCKVTAMLDSTAKFEHGVITSILPCVSLLAETGPFAQSNSGRGAEPRCPGLEAARPREHCDGRLI